MELIEGYKNEELRNTGGFGIADFEENMVLRFKNEHEISLYFDIVDQIS